MAERVCIHMHYDTLITYTHTHTHAKRNERKQKWEVIIIKYQHRFRMFVISVGMLVQLSFLNFIFAIFPLENVIMF